MIVRPATPADAAAISAFWALQIRDTTVTFNSVPKTPEDVAEMIASRPAFLVAEDSCAVLGFASYDQFRGGIGYRHTMEHTVILAPEAAGRGIGRALMTALEDMARGSGVHSLWAGVSAENPAGVAFHEAIGYEKIAKLPQVGFKFGRWMDLVLLQKRL